VITFPPEVVASPEGYAAAATLPEAERTTSGSGDAARARRDLAVPEFLELRVDAPRLRRFHEAAARLVQPSVADWTKRWRQGPLREVEHTGDLLRALAEADPAHLADASVHRLPPPADERRMGCCGTLGTFLP
ncbi:MAG: cupin, partial [Acidimicrobiales bacterium]